MRTSERPVEEKVNLREQRVLVERRPVDRPATGADLSDQDRVLEVRTIAEEPVVAKSARVVEEVEIGRDSSEHTETIRDTVRRKDVEVENLDEDDIQQPVPGSGPRERRPRP
jgi:stress response protein YsnF